MAALRSALALALLAAPASGRRAGEAALPLPVRCEVQGVSTLAIEVHPKIHLEGEVQYAEFQYLLAGHAGGPERRAVSEMVPMDRSASLDVLQSSVMEMCQSPDDALDFATQLVFDFLSGVALSFAAEAETCVAQFPGGAKFAFSYRCGARDGDEEVFFSGDGEPLAQYSVPGISKCDAKVGWRCDMPAARRVLLRAWRRLMEFRPHREAADIAGRLWRLLQCPVPEATADCVAPAVVLQQIARRLPQGAVATVSSAMEAALVFAIPRRYLAVTGLGLAAFQPRRARRGSTVSSLGSSRGSAVPAALLQASPRRTSRRLAAHGGAGA